MKRIGILVVAYNAASTLATVLDRIPKDFRHRISDVLVCDDFSEDSTYLVGLGYQQLEQSLPLTVIRQPRNLGYGGNQKSGYRWAIERELDIIVLLHGDGQYAPELLPEIVEPLERDQADAVFGSRMLAPGAARKGGMPLYKYAGNRILTRFENAVVGLELSEWHSGYRAYSVAALRDIPFDQNADGFHFDTQIILQLHDARKRIVEIPIPTYYGDEICHVNGLAYARDVAADVVRHRLAAMGFGTAAVGAGAAGGGGGAYEVKESDGSSHGRLREWVGARRGGRLLDLGCSDGAFGAELRSVGFEVTGVDREEIAPVADRLDHFVRGDLEQGIPDEVHGGFDVILAADVLEHVRHPEVVLRDAVANLAPGGSIITSIPNFAHWYPRLRTVLGRFDYDRRGILDQDHVRFFTPRSFERLVDRCGLEVHRREALGLPLEVARRGGRGDGTGGDGAVPDGEEPGHRGGRRRARAMGRRPRRTGLRPVLFSYQYLYELVPTRPR